MMFLAKIYWFLTIVSVVLSKAVDHNKIDDTHSNINKIGEPFGEEIEEIIQFSPMTTQPPKPLKEKLSFMDMVVLLALWNKERELNAYRSGPFWDDKLVSPISY